MARLVLIETAGNQDFVFATNKLRQNIGASELIHRIGTAFVLSAVATKVEAYAPLVADLERAFAAKNPGPPIDTADYIRRLGEAITKVGPVSAAAPVEVLVATSGKAVLLVDSETVGKDIIRAVTLRALREAPAAVVRGVVDSIEIEPTNSSKTAHDRMKEIHRALDRLRLDLPPPEARFSVLPITALCLTSGLPAEHHQDGELLSEPALCKRQAADAGWRRIKASLGHAGSRLARGVARLDDMGLLWFGVVHADGNGFGKVFLDLAAHIPRERGATARAYFSFYRELSFSLDMAGVVALRTALASLLPKQVPVRDDEREFLPVVPLVFGGDDVTLICEGRQAVSFTEAYLRAFEEATSASSLDGIPSVIPTLVDPDTKTKKNGFGGGAGIAIVKPHHPFHRAYELAEELTKSAKTTKTILRSDAVPNVDAVSAFDFQIVYDDAASDLDRLRRAWSIGDCLLHNRPYVVSQGERIEGIGERAERWIGQHHLDGLKAASRALAQPVADDDERPSLPRSQQHALRSALFAGEKIADARLALIRERYDTKTAKLKWELFGERDDSLFYVEHGVTISDRDGRQRRQRSIRTRFLDALELIDLGETLVERADVSKIEETAA